MQAVERDEPVTPDKWHGRDIRDLETFARQVDVHGVAVERINFGDYANVTLLAEASRQHALDTAVALRRAKDYRVGWKGIIWNVDIRYNEDLKVLEIHILNIGHAKYIRDDTVTRPRRSQSRSRSSR